MYVTKSTFCGFVVVDKNDAVNILMNLGLTNREAQVYLVLLQSGRMSANQIASSVRIQRPEAYRLVKELVDKGIATDHLGRPTLYESVEPDKVLESQIRKREEGLTELKSGSQKLAKLLDSIVKKRLDEENQPRFQMVSNKFFSKKLYESLKLAKQEVFFALKEDDAEALYLESFQNALSELARQGVAIKGIVEINSLNAPLRSFLKVQESERNMCIMHNQVNFGYLIIDKSKLLLGSGFKKNTFWLLTNSGDFIDAIAASFMQQWQTSKKYQSRLSELEAGVSDADLEQYRSLLQRFNGIVYRCNEKDQPIFIYGALKEITGYSEEEFLSGKLCWEQLIHPEERAVIQGNREKVFERSGGKAQQDYRLLTKGGRVIYVAESLENIGSKDKPLIQGSIYDITERKKTEDALRDSEWKFRTLTENVPLLLFRCAPDEEMTMLHVSGYFEVLLGYPLSAFEKKEMTTKQFVDPDFWPTYSRTIYDCLKKGQPYTIRWKLIDRHGKAHNVEERGRGIYGEKGELLFIDGAVMDLNE